MSVKHPELMYDPTNWATYVERLEERIAELEGENKRLKDLLAHWQEGDLTMFGEEVPTLESGE